MEGHDMQKRLHFINLLNVLKHTSRKGWHEMNVQNHETISGHMYAMAMMTFLIDKTDELDKTKCMQLALVHDLAESIVGDITPRDNIPEDVKHERELVAMQKISQLLDAENGKLLLNLYEEYLAKSTKEAKFVKDLDRFDMVFTASWYEKRDSTPDKLQEFFDSAEGKFDHPFMQKLVQELLLQRKNHNANMPSNSANHFPDPQ